MRFWTNMKIKYKLWIVLLLAVAAVAAVGLVGLNLQPEQPKTLLIVVMAVSIVVLLLLTLAVNSAIAGRMAALATETKLAAEGKFAPEMNTNDRDEIGEVRRSFARMQDNVLAVRGDIDYLVEQNKSGNVLVELDSDKHQGEFQKLIQAAAKANTSSMEGMEGILACIERFAQGDFDAKIPQQQGDKKHASDSLQHLRDNIYGVIHGVNRLQKSFDSGSLTERVDLEEFQGDWKHMASDINDLIDTILEPMKEAADVLSEVSKGTLSVKMTGNYEGDSAWLKNSINTTIDMFNSYVNDISHTLSQMSSDNLDVEITREYIGDFVVIKDSINEIVKKFNQFIGNVSAAADMVATGARQISDTSNTLHSGTLQQSSAVSELTSVIGDLHSQTMKNAENSTKAKDLSTMAMENAEQGNVEMKMMLGSMNAINESSQNISRIIKVIEDVAFQTNLLALNASVEAARAGEHGKGFAVVAEEVRNLSLRTQEAVRETTDLIQVSIRKVNEGTITAKKTAGALDKIVSDVTDVSNTIDEIEEASKEQTENIKHVNIGIQQISEVTHTNSFTSQESAAAAEELSGQSELLKGTFSGFRLAGGKMASSGYSPTPLDKPSSAFSPAVKPVVQPQIQQASTVQAKPKLAPQRAVESQRRVKPAVKSMSQSIDKPVAKPVAKPTVQPTKQPAAKQTAQSPAKPVSVARPVNTTASAAKRVSSQTPVNSSTAVKPTIKPAVKPTTPAYKSEAAAEKRKLPTEEAGGKKETAALLEEVDAAACVESSVANGKQDAEKEGGKRAAIKAVEVSQVSVAERKPSVQRTDKPVVKPVSKPMTTVAAKPAAANPVKKPNTPVAFKASAKPATTVKKEAVPAAKVAVSTTRPPAKSTASLVKPTQKPSAAAAVKPLASTPKQGVKPNTAPTAFKTQAKPALESPPKPKPAFSFTAKPASDTGAKKEPLITPSAPVKVGDLPVMAGQSRQDVSYNAADALLFDNKDWGKY